MKRFLALGLLISGLLGSFLVIRGFASEFGYSAQIALTHLLVVVSLCGLVALVGVLLYRFLPAQIRFLSSLPLTSLFLLLPLLYLSASFSNRHWGDNISPRLAIEFLLYDSTALSKIRGQLLGHPLQLILALPGAIAIIVAAHAMTSALGLWLHSPRVLIRLSWFLNLAIINPILVTIIFSQLRPEWFRGEPLSWALFRWPIVLDVAGTDQFRREVLLSDQIARSKYPVSKVTTSKNVIIIMLDSLRSDRMPLYGYDRPTTPFLSSLAEQGKLSNVAMALSTCSESFCGIASTLASHPYHRVTPGNFRLHEILRSVGYRNYLLLTGNHRQWAGLTEFYGPEYDLWYDYITQKLDMHSDQNVLTALNALPEAEGKPTFIFSFLMSTHVLGERLPQFRKYLPDQIEKFLPLWSERSLERSFERIAGTPFALGKLEVLSNNYDNGVLQADWVIRQIFETLQAKGYLEDAMVIILGDHGESLGEHDHVGHNLFLFQQNIQIPMFIWTSKPHRLKNAEFASHVDVAPTVLDFLGLPAAESFEGNSILTQEPRRFTVHQTRRGKQPCAAVVHREQPKHFLKVIMCRVGAQDLHIQAYDLTADPGESSNLWNTFSQSRREQLLKPLQFFSAQVINSCTTDDCLEPKATGES